MGLSERKRFISVPKDQKAMEDYNYRILEQDSMEEMVLSEEQYKRLNDTGVFYLINDKCDIMIDDYEDDWLESDKIPIAIEIVDRLINRNPNQQLLISFKKMLAQAAAYNTGVGFDF